MKVLAYPKDKNPYQELLYSEVRKQGVEVTYLILLTKSHILGMMILPLQLIYYRIRGYNIFHLHWLYDFNLATNIPLLKAISKFFYTFYIVTQIFLIKILGYKLIWTIHNLIPHESQFLNDLLVTKFLASISDICTVHSLSTKSQMEHLNIKFCRLEVVPHGSYLGYYKNTISKAEARRKLHINNNDFVFLFFGQLRNYKGIPDLLEHFKKIAPINNHFKLIIAGSCLDDNILRTIILYKKSLGYSLAINLVNIPDEDIQMYMNASDVVVFPFKKVTTSGSLLLAMSFGKPIIYPKEFFSELPDDLGYVYENIAELSTVMEKVSQDPILAQKGINARAYAEKFSWSEIAEKTYKMYESQLSKTNSE